MESDAATETPCPVSEKLEEIMLSASPDKVTQLKAKLHEINTTLSKACLTFLETRDKPRMIDLMTICHMLNKEELYILEDEEDINVDDLFINMDQYLNLGAS